LGKGETPSRTMPELGTDGHKPSSGGLDPSRTLTPQARAGSSYMGVVSRSRLWQSPEAKKTLGVRHAPRTSCARGCRAGCRHSLTPQLLCRPRRYTERRPCVRHSVESPRSPQGQGHQPRACLRGWDECLLLGASKSVFGQGQHPVPVGEI
jgi:hypothetical protein